MIHESRFTNYGGFLRSFRLARSLLVSSSCHSPSNCTSLTGSQNGTNESSIKENIPHRLGCGRCLRNEVRSIQGLQCGYSLRRVVRKKLFRKIKTGRREPPRQPPSYSITYDTVTEFRTFEMPLETGLA